MAISKIYSEETIKNFFSNLDSFDSLCLNFIDYCSKTKRPAIFDRDLHFVPLWNFPNKNAKIPYSEFEKLYITLCDFSLENFKKDSIILPKIQAPPKQISKSDPPKIPIPENIYLCPFHECYGEKAKNCLKGCHFFSDRTSALSSS